MKNAKDSMFALIKASQLSLNDEFMKHEPTSDKQREFKKRLTEAIEKDLSDFWAPKLDPSYSEDWAGLVYKAGKKPAVGRSYNWWKEKAEEYLPERGSRLGTKIEHDAFLGVFIKNLVASGWSVSNAWKAVCDDSKELGHYCNSSNAKYGFENTGSRKINGFCDLANTIKILAWDKEVCGFWATDTRYYVYSDDCPLAELSHFDFLDFGDCFSVGWIVLSK